MIESGWWYLKQKYPPFYTIVYVMRLILGEDRGKLGVWLTDTEGYCLIEDIGEDQFIKKVPEP